MGWNRVAHPTEGSPRRGLHGVPAILCGVNAVKDARRLLYLSKLGAKVVGVLCVGAWLVLTSSQRWRWSER